MAEIIENGYESIREFIDGRPADSWDYIELRDDEGNPVTRIGVSDERVEWTHNDGDQVLNLNAVVEGGDADITTPVTVQSSVLFNEDADGNEVTDVEVFTDDATLSADDDRLEVDHEVEVPQL